MENKRLDVLVAEQRGFSREYAKGCIERGEVSVGGRVISKPGAKFAADAQISITSPDMKYVGRGGYKLEAALEAFAITPSGRVCLDVGASTGGFTDCLLQNGAALVYAVDTGSDQLDDKLRENAHVISREKTDIRSLNAADFEHTPTLCTVDISFISLTKVIPALLQICGAEADFLLLVKPQFEAGRASLNKKGVVRSREEHVRVLREIIAFAEDSGLCISGLCVSPIRGQNGNIEYLLHAARNGARLQTDIKELVRQAFSEEKGV